MPAGSLKRTSQLPVIASIPVEHQFAAIVGHLRAANEPAPGLRSTLAGRAQPCRIETIRRLLRLLPTHGMPASRPASTSELARLDDGGTRLGRPAATFST